jgi:hypothetical protein
MAVPPKPPSTIHFINPYPSPTLTPHHFSPIHYQNPLPQPSTNNTPIRKHVQPANLIQLPIIAPDKPSTSRLATWVRRGVHDSTRIPILGLETLGCGRERTPFQELARVWYVGSRDAQQEHTNKPKMLALPVLGFGVACPSRFRGMWRISCAQRGWLNCCSVSRLVCSSSDVFLQ